MIHLIWIIPLLLVLLLILYGIIRVREFSQALFGTKDVIEGIRREKRNASERPKSLQSMEAVYLPKIKRDFPDLNLSELKKKAERVLLSSLQVLSTQDMNKLSDEAGEEIRQKLKTALHELEEKKLRQFYDHTHIHKTVVSEYKKDHGLCWIVLQTGLETYSYLLDGDKVIAGDKEYKTQAVFELRYLYVQDLDLAGMHGSALGINCPNCGAPIRSLGNKYCEYCGSGIKEINIKVWRLVDYHLL